MVSTSAKPLGYYVSSKRTSVQKILFSLSDTWGDRLESMTDEFKRVFRAALATYQVLEPIWDEEDNDITCIDACIAGAGGDDLGVWADDDFVIAVQDVAAVFSESQIEGLIEALTAQLRG